MRKVICLCLCALILSLTIGAVRGDAVVSAQIYPAKESAQRGDIVPFTLSLENCSAACSVSITLVFDNTVFALESGGWLVTDAQSAGFDNGTAHLTYPEDRPMDGDVLTFRLRVLDEAAFAESQVTCLINIESAAGPLDAQVAARVITVVCAHNYHPWSDADDAQHSRSCRICGNRETAAHDYSNACDSSCNTCGHTRETAHVFDKAWHSNATVHYHTCTGCGLRQNEEAHIPGEAATEKTPQICTVCQYELAPALGHTHQFSENWETDSKKHWHACTGCKVRQDEAAHRFDNACDPDCNGCGYTREIVHSYADTWEQNAQGHWHSCSVCGLTDGILSHTPGEAATEESAQLCTDCGYELAPALPHQHVAAEGYTWDQLNHWILCECGTCIEIAAHQWDEGTVTREPTAAVSGERLCTCTVCGATKTIEIRMTPAPAIQIPQPSDTAEETPSAIPMVLVGILIGIAGCITVQRALKKPTTEQTP